MGFFKLGTMTIGSIFKKAETRRYPFVQKEPFPNQKGHVEHINHEVCNLCQICAKKCPCKAIDVNRDEKTWSINHFQCVQCGYCVSSCPKKCLNMNEGRPEIGTKKEVEVVNIPLPDKKPAAKPAAAGAKEAPKATKVEDGGKKATPKATKAESADSKPAATKDAGDAKKTDKPKAKKTTEK